MEEESIIKKVTDEDILKVRVARLERDKYETNDVAGVVTGLAWTSVGGDILSLNHCSKGNHDHREFRNVMKESATIALEYIKANAELVGINPEALQNTIFLHRTRRCTTLKMAQVQVLPCYFC
jgi:ATP-dependent Lon protease